MKTKEFNLKEIMDKPTNKLTNHEFYLRYKDKIKTINKKNYSKYSFGLYVKKYKNKNKEKVRAKEIAVKIKIPKNKLCENCQESFATQKHHEDYSKPLEVKFVCRDCHGELDRLRRIRENGI